MNPADLKTALLAEAHTLGFDVCRVAAAGSPPHAEEFREWLGEEKHGDMTWLARNADRRKEALEALENLAAVTTHLKHLLLIRDLRKIAK